MLFAFVTSASEAAERPNVLLILVDDLKPAMGCYGDPLAKTPHLDALAGRGMRFDLAYCNQAVCAPSRFTLMLGSHSTSTGLYGLGSQLRDIMPDAITMPQYFAKHGYRTESLGKVFHIGHGNYGDPKSFSVPHFKEKVVEYADPASKPDGRLTREEAMFQNVKAPSGGMNSLPRGAAFEHPDVEDTAYADGRVAAETIRRLQAAANRQQPFFIVSGFARPHLPFSAPKKYWDLYDANSFPLASHRELPANSPKVAHKRGGEIRNYFPVPDKNDPAAISDSVARKLIHGYYASTSYVDAQIGKVIDELDRLAIADNTIVVLWGDHGFHLGDLGIWTKHTNYEQANRIPIVIAAPGITSPASSTRQPAESVDLFPTLAELAGLPTPKVPQSLDGKSLVRVLKDPEARVRDHAYHAYPKRKLGRAIRTERYRLVEWRTLNAPDEPGEYELYDYETDPLETRNLADEQTQVVARLKEILAAYPEPVDPKAKQKSRSQTAVKTPLIDNRPLDLKVEVLVDAGARGVVIAQGGRQHGYALHFLNGRPAFDVRVDGKVTRLISGPAVSGRITIEASLSEDAMSLSVNNSNPLSTASPGLLPVQPVDGLSVGADDQTAAGNYSAPNPFSGKIIQQKVVAQKAGSS